jgi:hypothetical protein
LEYGLLECLYIKDKKSAASLPAIPVASTIVSAGGT